MNDEDLLFEGGGPNMVLKLYPMPVLYLGEGTNDFWVIKWLFNGSAF